MDYSTAIKKLWNHANLPEKISQLPKEESFCCSLWQSEQTKQEPELDWFYLDIMECLEAVNFSLNAAHPSESIEGKAEAIDRKISYAVSGILSTCWLDYYRWTSQKTFSESFLHSLACVLVRIGMAWDLVLAGDVDEIRHDAESGFQVYIQP